MDQQSAIPNQDPKIFTSSNLATGDGNNTVNNGKKVNLRLLILILAGILLLGGILTVFFRKGLGINQTPPTSQQQQNQNASPSSDSSSASGGIGGITLEGKTEATLGEEFEVKVWASADEASNLFSADLRFDTNVLEAKKIDTKGSFISLFLSRNTDNKAGKVAIAGAVPNPGKTTGGKNELLATIVFKAKGKGQTTLDMAGETGIYSNSTNKNILKDKKTLTVKVN